MFIYIFLFNLVNLQKMDLSYGPVFGTRQNSFEANSIQITQTEKEELKIELGLAIAYWLFRIIIKSY